MKYLVAFNIKKLMREKEQLFHLQSLCNKIIVKCLFLETKKINYNFFLHKLNYGVMSRKLIVLIME